MTWLTNPGFVFGVYVGVYAVIIGSLKTTWLRMVGCIAGLFIFPLVSVMLRDNGVSLLSTYPNRGFFMPGALVGIVLGGLIYWLLFVVVKPKIRNTKDEDGEE